MGGRTVHPGLVDQNYLRADTIAAANAALITAQPHIELAQMWGGGLLASVDGLRFVVPVKSTPGPRQNITGIKRGVTWLNAVNDQVAGIGAMVVRGTPRDSLYTLDTLLNLDGGGAALLCAAPHSPIDPTSNTSALHHFDTPSTRRKNERVQGHRGSH
jgi:hypothetical protein